MKKLTKEGFQPGGKQQPYAGPMYSGGTKFMDTTNVVGAVEGPNKGKGTPDPLGYTKK